jgi:hypothetical protein
MCRLGRIKLLIHYIFLQYIKFYYFIYPIYSPHGQVAWLLSNIYANYDLVLRVIGHQISGEVVKYIIGCSSNSIYLILP